MKKIENLKLFTKQNKKNSLLKKFLRAIYKVKTKQSGKKNFYILGVKLFSLNKKISKLEESELYHIQNKFPKIIPFDIMIDKIKKGASLARFGDAEFDIAMNKNKNDPYQKPSKVLSQKLFQILNRSCSDKLLIAIPPFNAKHNNIKKYYKNISFWQWYWMSRWKELNKFITQSTYANSFFSRDSVFYELSLNELKSIWDKRNVVFVVPKNGRFFYDNRLFDNIKKKEEINVPATSAFSQYDRILKECLKYPKDYLFFICAGPTATVLAVDLADKGYQALDMGHFPNCYLEFLGESNKPEMYPIVK